MNKGNHFFAPDLTKRPPRSVRCRLGGYVTLPRLLDKGRATIAGSNGEFNYDASMDQHIIRFLGIDVAALKEQLATGQGDGEILEWLIARAPRQHTPWEIEQWSDYMLRRPPDSDQETLIFFFRRLALFSKTRTDIHTWMDLLDLDDFATFGGKP